MRQVISRARRLATPTARAVDSKRRTAEYSFSLVREQAGRHGQVTGVEFGGSYAKGTWLAGDADVDIFVRFKKSTPEEEFVGISQEIGFAAMKDHGPYVRYSDHPYVEATVGQTRINIVPCYDVKPGRWKSAADRSPYHTRNMQDSLTAKMRGEVRLLKTFLRAAGIYGAEIARQGFSGYVSEVLILNFKSFENVVKEVAGLEENFVVGKAKKKFDTPIVIVDPIDGRRNLAAAISGENVGRFVLRCRAFQRRPGLRFFRKAGPRESGVDPKNILVVRFSFRPRSPEVIWGQIKRATSSLATQLNMEGFNVLRSMPYTDERRDAYLLFLLESVTVPEVRANTGPEFFRESYADRFIGKNIKKSRLMWVGRDGRIVSLERRGFTDARKLLKSLIEDNCRAGLPKGLRDDFKKGFAVFAGTGRLGKSIKEAAQDLVSTDDTFFHFD